MTLLTAILKRLRWFFLEIEPWRAPRWELIIFRIALVLMIWDMHSGLFSEWWNPLEALRLAAEHAKQGEDTAFYTQARRSGDAASARRADNPTRRAEARC